MLWWVKLFNIHCHLFCDLYGCLAAFGVNLDVAGDVGIFKPDSLLRLTVYEGLGILRFRIRLLGNCLWC